jgi:hypothetical protein
VSFVLQEEGMKEKFAIVPFVAKSEMVVYEKEGEESFMLSPDDQEFSPSPRPGNVSYVGASLIIVKGLVLITLGIFLFSSCIYFQSRIP